MHLKEDSFEDAVREFKELKTKCEKTIRTWFPKGTGILTSTRSVFYDGHEYYCGRPGTNGVEGRMPRFERKVGNQYFITIYRRQAKMVNR